MVTPIMHQPAYIIPMAADVLVPNRHQDIRNHPADLTDCSVMGIISYNRHIMLLSLNNQWSRGWKGGLQPTGFLIIGSFVYSTCILGHFESLITWLLVQQLFMITQKSSKLHICGRWEESTCQQWIPSLKVSSESIVMSSFTYIWWLFQTTSIWLFIPARRPISHCSASNILTNSKYWQIPMHIPF